MEDSKDKIRDLFHRVDRDARHLFFELERIFNVVLMLEELTEEERRKFKQYMAVVLATRMSRELGLYETGAVQDSDWDELLDGVDDG